MNHRLYLSLAIPLTISTITTPLLGAVDTAVIGQLPDPAFLGGVAVGTVIFNTMYWLFGFLRVSTSGFAAQAIGAKQHDKELLSFTRPVLIAFAVALFLLLFQKPIFAAAIAFISPAADVQSLAQEYFAIRIWGVPFTLMNYVIIGYLMGISKIRMTVMIQIFMNSLNILLDLLFVLVFSWGVTGVASATVISEVTGFVIGASIILRLLPVKKETPSWREFMNWSAFGKMMAVNRDLFIRTICLLTVFNLFTMKGASFGTEVLAANAVLIQIHYLMAYFFDGFANASSILSGRAVGSLDRPLMEKTITLTMQWGALTALFLSGAHLVLGDQLIRGFTSIPAVQEIAMTYSSYLLLFPLCTSFGIVFYGVFTGATETGAVRNSMILALAVYVLILLIAVPAIGNHGLWLAFILFGLGRSLFLLMYMPKIRTAIEVNEAKI